MCRRFLQIADEICLCPQYTCTSITVLSVETQLLEWSLHHKGELTSSNSTFTSIFSITFFYKISSQCIYVQGGGVLHTCYNILPNQPSELAHFNL